jgi:O-antigen ligase/tetratricopeptide (TPR) repeat protein
LLLLVHLLLCPLFFCRGTIDAFEYPKVTLLVLVTGVLVVLGLTTQLGRNTATVTFRSLRQRLGRLGREPIALGVLLLAGSALVSTVLSLSPRTSLRGAVDSHAGLGTVLAGAALFFATRRLCPTAAAGRRLLGVTVVAMAGVSLYALVQVLHGDPFRWDNVSGYGGFIRPAATLGHPNLLAAYLVMAFPVAAHGACRAASARNWPAFLALAPVCVLAALIIAVSLSRGAWLALVCTLAVLLVGWWQGGRKRWAAALGAGLLLAGAGLVLFCLTTSAGRHFLGHVFTRGRHLGEFASRRQIWKAGLAIFKDFPVCGCGLDTFQLAFGRRRPLAYWQLEWGVTPTRAHNEAIHLLATQGSLGGIAGLVLTVGLVVTGARAWRRAGPDEKPLVAAILAGVTGFYVQNLFSFTVVSCGTLFITYAALLSRFGTAGSSLPRTTAVLPGQLALGLTVGVVLAGLTLLINLSGETVAAGPGLVAGCLAVVAFLGVVAVGVYRLEAADKPGRGQPGIAPEGVRSRVSRWRRLAQGGVWAGAAALGFCLVVQPFRANLACATGESLENVDLRRALESYEEAAILDPGNPLPWTRLGAAAEHAARQSDTAEERRRFLARARQALGRVVALVPVDPSAHDNLGRLWGAVAGPEARPERAFRAFERALALDPRNLDYLVDAAQGALACGDLARARRYADRGSRCYPACGQPRAQLAYAALLGKQRLEGILLLYQALNGDWHGDEPAMLNAVLALAQTHLALGDPQQTWKLAEMIVRRRPDLPGARLTLALALEKLGCRDRALAEYRRVLDLDPSQRLARLALRRLGTPTSPQQ